MIVTIFWDLLRLGRLYNACHTRINKVKSKCLRITRIARFGEAIGLLGIVRRIAYVLLRKVSFFGGWGVGWCYSKWTGLILCVLFYSETEMCQEFTSISLLYFVVC